MLRVKISSIYFFIGAVVCFSSLPTVFIGVSGGALNAIACIVAIPIFLLLLQHDKVVFPRQLSIVIAQLSLVIIFVMGFSITLLNNEPSQFIATISRYFFYFLVFILSYNLALRGVLTLRKLDRFNSMLLFVLAFFSLLQLILGSRPLMNGAYRLSSIFGPNPAGFALVILFLSIYFWFRASLNRVFVIHFMLSCIMLLMVHSRQASLTLFISLFLLLFFSATLNKKIVYILVFVFFAFIFYWLVINTNIFPRFADMLNRDGYDGSTATRLYIIQSTISNLNFYEVFVGVGLGGFNSFFGRVTGEYGVAAHNDLLLFFTETGLLGLFLYMVYLCSLLFYAFKMSAVFKQPIFLVLFIAFPVMSFINNPYYYPQVQWLLLTFSGVFIAKYNLQDKRDSYV